jgi:hypothetical protein
MSGREMAIFCDVDRGQMRRLSGRFQRFHALWRWSSDLERHFCGWRSSFWADHGTFAFAYGRNTSLRCEITQIMTEREFLVIDSIDGSAVGASCWIIYHGRHFTGLEGLTPP